MDFNQILGNLGFDWRVALANLVNFLIIFLILKHFALKPVEKIIKERRNKINKGVEDAKKSSAELQMAKQTSEKTILDARNQANKIIAAGRQESEKIIAQGRVLQEEQTKKIMEKADKIILQKKEKMMQELKSETADLVVLTAKKFVKEDITKEKREKIDTLLNKALEGKNK